jgi:putative ABC transport system substrate-binding protein
MNAPGVRGLVLVLRCVAMCIALAAPGHTLAKPPESPWRVTVLLTIWSTTDAAPQSLRKGLSELGYVEGRDVRIDWRSAGDDFLRLPELARDAVNARPDAIVTDGTAAARVLMRETSSIPIVVAMATDPEGAGLAANRVRPGHNVTGLIGDTVEMTDRRLQLMQRMIPGLRRLAVVGNAESPNTAQVLDQLRALARSRRLELLFVAPARPDQFARIFLAARNLRAEALYVIDEPLFQMHRQALAHTAAQLRFPVLYPNRRYVDAGGLASHGADLGDLFRRAAGYLQRIFQGASPADLPMEEATVFESAVNKSAATGLGLRVPSSVREMSGVPLR